jgi:hypothetical protein
MVVVNEVTTAISATDSTYSEYTFRHLTTNEGRNEALSHSLRVCCKAHL